MAYVPRPLLRIIKGVHGKHVISERLFPPQSSSRQIMKGVEAAVSRDTASRQVRTAIIKAAVADFRPQPRSDDRCDFTWKLEWPEVKRLLPIAGKDFVPPRRGRRIHAYPEGGLK